MSGISTSGDDQVQRRNLSAGPQVPGRSPLGDFASKRDASELGFCGFEGEARTDPLTKALDSVGGDLNRVCSGHALRGA